MSMVVNEQVAVQATRQLNQDFADTLNAVTSGYGAIDILQKGIHKAWGVEQLMQKIDRTVSKIVNSDCCSGSG